MVALSILKNWLTQCPYWNGSMYVDYTPATPDCGGMYPGGVEELSRQKDVLDRVTVKNRCRFTVLRTVAAQQDKTQHAQWMQEFAHWIQEQSARGNCPVFGDDPAGECIRAQQGKLSQVNSTGVSKYTVEITVDFTKIYE